MTYVSARKRSSKSLDVLYTADAGKVFVRHGGSRAWRNNNPGNLRKSIFATEQGAIGEAGGFAVFPDYQTGRQALKALLKTETYKTLTIEDAVKRYAPPKENATDAYAKNLKKLTGLEGTTKLADLKDVQLDAVVSAIEKLEGTIAGTETPLIKIVGAISEHGRIVAYELDDGSGVVGRDKAVSLARAGLLDAVLVAGRSGFYLRASPDEVRLNNLDVMAAEAA